MVRRFRNTLAELLASLKLLGTLGVLAAFFLANDGGSGGDAGSGETGGDGSSTRNGDAGNTGSTGGGSDDGANGGKAGGESTGTTGKVEFNDDQQAHIAKLVAEERAKAAAAAKKEAAEEAKKATERAKMDEAERLKAEKADAEKAAADRVSKANATIVKAEARAQAASAGVKADQLATFLRLVDLDGVTVSDEGEPDEKAVKSAIDKALKDEAVKAAFTGEGKGSSRSGTGMNGGGEKGRAKSIEEAVNGRLTAANA